MKKTFLQFATFLIGLAVVDLAVGFVYKPIWANEPDAGVNHSNLKQSLFNKKADILVLGASKANHHYITDSLEYRFGMSVFNAGLDGDNIVTSRVQFDALKDKCPPKMVILDLSGGQMAGKWDNMFLSHKVYYGLESHYTHVANQFISIENRVKLLSSLYKLNEELPDIVLSYLKGNRGCNGFIPLVGSNEGISHRVKDAKEPYVMGDVQRNNLDYIVKYCKENKITLIVIYSPSLNTYINGNTQTFEVYCREQEIPFFNYESDTVYTNHPEFFKDYNHLNIIGAQVFTSDVIKRIKNYLGEQ